MIRSPWDVESIQDFQFYNCPSCVFMHKDESEFVQHALDVHPDCNKFILKLYFGEEDATEEDTNDHQNRITSDEKNDKPDKVLEDDFAHNEVTEKIQNEYFEIDESIETNAIGNPVDNAETINDDDDDIEDFIENGHEGKIGNDDQIEVKVDKDDFNAEIEEIDENNCNVDNVKAEDVTLEHVAKVDTRENECHIYNRTFRLVSAFRLHNLALHPEDILKTEKCDVCGNTFYTKKLLEVHMNASDLEHKRNNLDGKFDCPQCYLPYTSELHLVRHYKKEHFKEVSKNIKIKNNTCNICGKLYSGKKSLAEHVNLVHLKLRPFQCHLCEKAFCREYKLQDHITFCHFGVRNHVCDKCGKSFGSKEDLRVHNNFVHEKLKKVKCEECDRMFNAKPALSRHVATVHRKEKHILCDTCGKEFYCERELKQHLISHGPKPTLLCKICGKNLNYPSNLAFHMKTHNPLNKKET